MINAIKAGRCEFCDNAGVNWDELRQSWLCFAHMAHLILLRNGMVDFRVILGDPGDD